MPTIYEILDVTPTDDLALLKKAWLLQKARYIADMEFVSNDGREFVAEQNLKNVCRAWEQLNTEERAREYFQYHQATEPKPLFNVEPVNQPAEGMRFFKDDEVEIFVPVLAPESFFTEMAQDPDPASQREKLAGLLNEQQPAGILKQEQQRFEGYPYHQRYDGLGQSPQKLLVGATAAEALKLLNERAPLTQEPAVMVQVTVKRSELPWSGYANFHGQSPSDVMGMKQEARFLPDNISAFVTLRRGPGGWSEQTVAGRESANIALPRPPLEQRSHEPTGTTPAALKAAKAQVRSTMETEYAYMPSMFGRRHNARSANVWVAIQKAQCIEDIKLIIDNQKDLCEGRTVGPDDVSPRLKVLLGAQWGRWSLSSAVQNGFSDAGRVTGTSYKQMITNVSTMVDGFLSADGGLQHREEMSSSFRQGT